MKKANFWALVKKEFFAYVNSPLAYVVIVPFLLISTFMYFRTALVLGDANLRPFIELLPWFLVVIGPALAMRSFTDEYRRDTIELLYAHPLSEWMIAGAKFLGIYLFFGVLLLSTVCLPVSIIAFAKPDIGLMIGQYLGAFFIGAAFLAVGMAAGAFVVSSVGSFLLGAALNFALLLIGLNFVVLALPAPFNRILIELGAMSHLNNISRGMLDLRDVLYFVTVVGVALAAAVMRLSQRKLAENQVEKRKLWVIMGLIVGIGLVGNVLMLEFPIRLDLTTSQRYSLSQGTKKLLRELPDKVLVTLYASNNLPGPMQVTLRETTDRLKDFSRYGRRLEVKTVTVGNEMTAKTEAMQAGVREVQFNQVAAGSFQVQTGFLGLTLRYGDKTEAMEFIEDAANLEYDLSRLILKMTRDKLPKIGVVEANSRGDTLLSEYLGKQYEVVTITEDSQEDTSGLAAVIVVDDGSDKQATAAAKVKNFVANGGNVLALVDGVNINRQVLVGNASKSDMTEVFADQGLRVSKNLVYDLQLNEAISLGQGGMQYIVAYPFWVRALLNQEKAPWSGAATNTLLGWPSSLTVSESVGEGVEVTKILITGENAGAQTSQFTIQPAQLKGLPQTDLKEMVLGAMYVKDKQRLVLVGDSDMVGDEFLQNSAENQSFVANMIDWVAADEILASIPKRGSDRTVFNFKSAAMIPIVQYGNMLIPALLVAGFGGWWLRRRKMLTMRTYA